MSEYSNTHIHIHFQILHTFVDCSSARITLISNKYHIETFYSFTIRILQRNFIRIYRTEFSQRISFHYIIYNE